MQRLKQMGHRRKSMLTQKEHEADKSGQSHMPDSSKPVKLKGKHMEKTNTGSKSASISLPPHKGKVFSNGLEIMMINFVQRY